MIWRGSSGVLEAHRGTPVPSAPYSPSFITTEGKHPRGSPAFRGIKVIVTYGDLREMIQDVSGRRRFNSSYPAPNSDSNDFESSLKKSGTVFLTDYAFFRSTAGMALNLDPADSSEYPVPIPQNHITAALNLAGR